MVVTTNPELTLRDYQRETLNRIRELYDQGVNRSLVIKATGTGKTITVGHVPSYFPELMRYGMLAIVHTDELAYQMQEKIEWVCPQLRVDLEKAEYTADPTADVVVTSRQTLGQQGSVRLRGLLRHRKFGIVACDEAHHVYPGGQYDNILSLLGLGTNDAVSDLLPNGKPRLSIGVTATPNRNDGVGLSHFYDDIAINFDLRAGIEEGYLCDIQAYQVDTGTHIENARVQAGEFVASEIAKLTDTDPRNSLVVSAWKEYSGGQALAFTATVQHAHHLAATFRAAGVAATAVDGGTPKEERKIALERYERGEINVLVNCALLTEGYDSPVTDTILMVRPIRSTPLYIQVLGRGTRTLPPEIGNLPTREERLEAIANSEKPYMKLIDFVDVAGDHELVTLPRLFGMSQTFRTEGEERGRFVKDTVRRVEELIAESPHKEEQILESGSFEEMEVEASKIDVWDVARVTDEIKKMTDLSWMRMGPYAYRLEIPAERRYFIRVEEDHLGHWHTEVRYPTQYVDGRGKVAGEAIKSNRKYESAADAISAVDAYVKKHHRSQMKLLEHTPKWGSKEATQGQKGFLRRLKVDFPADIRRGEASRLINAALAMKESKKRRKKASAANVPSF